MTTMMGIAWILFKPNKINISTFSKTNLITKKKKKKTKKKHRLQSLVSSTNQIDQRLRFKGFL